MKKKKKKNRQFRLGVEYALLMINKYVEYERAMTGQDDELEDDE